MLFEMGGERSKNRVRIATGVQRCKQMLMKACHGSADGADRALSAVLGAAAMLPLKFGDGFQFAKGFLFDGFGLVFIVQDGFEFSFLPQDGSERLGVIECETALLNSGVALEQSRFPGSWVGDLGQA